MSRVKTVVIKSGFIDIFGEKGEHHTFSLAQFQKLVLELRYGYDSPDIKKSGIDIVIKPGEYEIKMARYLYLSVVAAAKAGKGTFMFQGECTNCGDNKGHG